MTEQARLTIAYLERLRDERHERIFHPNPLRVLKPSNHAEVSDVGYSAEEESARSRRLEHAGMAQIRQDSVQPLQGPHGGRAK